MYLIYFVAGILVNILFTVQIRYIDHDKVVLASVTAFLTTLMSFAVWYTILTQSEGIQGMIGIACYSIGIGIGAFIAMKLKFRYRGKDIV